MSTTAFVVLALLTGCAAQPTHLTAQQRAARTADVTPIGPHPARIRSSFPPADPSYHNLNCAGGGENTTVCSRGN